MLMPDGKITKKGLNQLRSRIGVDLRVRQYNEEASQDAIRQFASGIGDPNPMWHDPGHGFKSTRFGTMIAPPTFLYSILVPTGALAGGLPGVHSFFGGNDWEWYKTIRADDKLSAKAQLSDVVEKDQSEAAGRSVIQYVDVIYKNQHYDVVAKAKGWAIRCERGALREKSKYVNLSRSPLTKDQIQLIERTYDEEKIRGDKIRYWDDVKEGDVITPVAKGPLALGDIQAYCSTTLPVLAYGALLRYLKKHPAYGYHHPQSNRLEPVERVNQDDYAAADIGIPAAFDYGHDRICWIGHALTNWMGDEGFLKKLYVEIRRPVLFGDAIFCKGNVVRKYKEGDEFLVDLEIWAENHRSEITAPGQATIKLVCKEVPGGHSYLYPN